MANYRQMLYTVGKAIESQINRINRHMHSGAKCYPTLAAGKSVQAASSAWTLGNFAEIIPANAIAAPFDIHYLNIEATPGAGTYEIHLYTGALGEEVEIGFVRTTKLLDGLTAAVSVPFQMDVVPKNTRISAKLASSLTNGPTVTFSAHYHTY
jgi:hypothetical protein